MRTRILILGGAAAVALLSAPAFALTPEQQYEQAMQRYHEQQREYREARQRYDRHWEAYEYNRAHPYTWWRSDYTYAPSDRYYSDDNDATEYPP